jgi:hypothetical protein
MWEERGMVLVASSSNRCWQRLTVEVRGNDRRRWRLKELEVGDDGWGPPVDERKTCHLPTRPTHQSSTSA